LVQINYNEQLNIDYRWFDLKGIQPNFEFGFGLSYTTFSYSNLHVSHIKNGTVLWQANATITNTGNVAGSEVAQLYLGFPPAAGEPPKVLRGFEKIFLSPGESGNVLFPLDFLDFSVS
jgi:beta-glucosidase